MDDEVTLDNDTSEDTEETTREDEVDESAETQEVTTDKTSTDKTDEQAGDKTSKGTKLDPDPLSQANQLRANAESKAQRYETLLNDPVALEKYLATLKGDKTDSTDPTTEIKLEDVQTTGDLQKFLAQERAKDKKEIESVKSELQNTAALNQYDSDLATVRKEFPDITEAQEKIIGDLFETTNFDKDGKYTPRVRLVDLARKVMELSEESKKEGSKQAQTIVRTARSGRNVSGTVAETTADESHMTAEQVIASRMKQAGLGRK